MESSVRTESKRYVQKIIDGKDVYSTEPIPAGSKEFWEKIFGNSLPDEDIIKYADDAIIHENES